MLEKLEAIQARFEEIGIALTNPEIVSDNKKFSQLSKEYRSLEKIVQARKAYLQVLADIEAYKQALEGNDAELRELAKEELPSLEEKRENLEKNLRQLPVSYTHLTLPTNYSV